MPPHHFTVNAMSVYRLIFLFATLALGGCASTHAKNPADPLEAYNRTMFSFNDAVDKAVAKPVAQGYDAVMPEPGKIMVGNFFSNLDDIIVTANDLLQLKFSQAASDGSRVVFNTTFGLFGLLDITSRLEKHNEDFGQTLGYWGVSSGPYIVLPILGPSTVRDSVGSYVDSRPSKLRRVTHMRTRNQLYLTKAIDRRAELLEQEKVLDEAVLDRYEYIRDAYLLRRQSLVSDGSRQSYLDDDEEEENRHVPIPHVPSAQSDQPPADAKTSPSVAVPAEQHVQHVQQPSVHKVWIAQKR